jgi:hypothetical protein
MKCTDHGYYCSGGKKERCKDGTFTSPDGSFCQQCMPGNECDASTGPSTLCAAGSYNDGTFTKCQPCPIGSYQDGVGGPTANPVPREQQPLLSEQ